MEKEFVVYSLALRMKKLGYNESCFGFYQVENFEEKPCGVDDRDEYIRTGFATCKNSEIPEHFTSAPTWQQAFRWFREKYNIHIRIEKYDETKWWANWGSWTSEVYDSYEEAELACLKKLIEIVE
jgi:hypothetical protein